MLRDARERLVKPGGVFVPHRSATTAVACSGSPVLEGLRPEGVDATELAFTRPGRHGDGFRATPFYRWLFPRGSLSHVPRP
ncbi:hypothetical protein [Streptomyces sp. MK37H]|uniref:hypothetical protein n=1 Tax=Streptomyces sp. MK37H TaxID=2699117 RepID=UPI001B396090|nr:hypothetical protein [Streptomyces sp. MK37H]